MTKIKLLKDIPGYKKGEILETKDEIYPTIIFSEIGLGFEYNVSRLISHGWAEEIKDDIDIEEIRNDYLEVKAGGKYITNYSDSDAEWFTAYRIVKAVIEKLNGDSIELLYAMWNIDYHFGSKTFAPLHDPTKILNILPMCGSAKIAAEVISLCEPELKVLFGVK